MKNNVFKMIVVLIIIVLVVMATALLNNKESGQKADYVRIHIRANSNSDIDQNLKHKVKKDIIKYLTPLLATAHTKEAALNIIDQNINNLRIIADEVLVKNQASYMSSAVIIQEEFPTRSYGEFVLEKGLYDALIINLGEGKGDNWWCVAFPPLCFVPENGANVRYKSKILEIINKAK